MQPKRHHHRIATIIAALGLASSPALANQANPAKPANQAKPAKKPPRQTGPASQANQSSHAPRAAKTKNYDFLADEIDGDRIRPDNTTIFGIKDARHSSLIRLRSDFIPEILKSADML